MSLEEKDIRQVETPEQTEAQETQVPAEEKEKGHTKKDKKNKKDEQIEKLTADNAELTDKLMRKAAEFDNYRKRTEREKLESVTRGMATALEGLLPAFDALKLASAAPCSDENFKKGVDMTLSIFNMSLEKLGIEEINPLGQPFDPNFCTAVFTEAAEEGVESGTVTKVLQSGYKRGDKVIRVATVAVCE